MDGFMRHEPDLEARSPWSRYNGYKEVRLAPPERAIDAVITVPGSKSLTNRALILAALAEGSSRLEGVLMSDDSYWCIRSLMLLGISVEVEQEESVVMVHGVGGKWPIRGGELYVGAAGTVARFLPAALATGEGQWHLNGSRRLRERPLAPLLEGLTQQGAEILYGETSGCLPLSLQANGLRGGELQMQASVSSQFISALLLAAPYARKPLTLEIEGQVVQYDYVEMTLDMMRQFGAEPEVRNEGRKITVLPTGYRACSLLLEPDVSTCGYFWALSAATNGRIRIQGITATTRQPDIELLDVLERMGCTIIRGEDFVEVRGTKRLKGGFSVSMKRWSDQTLTLAALAPFADGPITLTDAAHIRHHECDRIAAICKELRKLGIQVDEHPDGLTVYPGEPQPALLDTHDDHRMAMALSLIGVRAEGIALMDPNCVAKTCPDYFERLQSLGVSVELLRSDSPEGAVRDQLRNSVGDTPTAFLKALDK